MELIGRKHKLLAGAAAVAMTLLILGSIAALSDHYALRNAPPVEVAGKRPIPCSPPHRLRHNIAVKFSDQRHAPISKKWPPRSAL